jgi:hypothetical protein
LPLSSTAKALYRSPTLADQKLPILLKGSQGWRGSALSRRSSDQL